MTELTFSIQKAKKEDIPAIVEMVMKVADLHHQLAPDYWQGAKAVCKTFREHLKEEIDNPKEYLLVLKTGSKYIGYVNGLVCERKAVVEKELGYIENAYISEEFRGYGLMRMAIDELYRWFKKKKIKTVEVGYFLRNPLAVRCWEGLGFEPFTCRAKMQLSELHKKSSKRRRTKKATTKSNSR